MTYRPYGIYLLVISYSNIASQERILHRLVINIKGPYFLPIFTCVVVVSHCTTCVVTFFYEKVCVGNVEEGTTAMHI